MSASSFEPHQHLESYRIFSSQSVQLDEASPPVGMPLSNQPFHNDAPAPAHQGLHVPMLVAIKENLVNSRFQV